LENGNTGGRYLTTQQVAERLCCSRRTVQQLLSDRAVPHLKLPTMRRALFDEAHLDAWESGAQLEEILLPRGGRLVRPVEEPAR
jgi:excisionase family DNA binding protein